MRNRDNKKMRLSAVFVLVAASFLSATQSLADVDWEMGGGYVAQEPEPIFDDTPHFREGVNFTQSAQLTTTIELPNGAGIIELPDLSSHPLAGTEVEILLEVQDGLGQTTRTEAVRITLPRPILRNPINESLAEIRRELATDPDQALELSLEMQDLLDSLPEESLSQEALQRLQEIQQELNEAAQSLTSPSEQNNMNDPDNRETPSNPSDPSASPEAPEMSPDQAKEQLDEVIDELWEAMQELEQEAISEAEKKFNEAQEALAEALENGANSEELQQLTQEAQEAMQELLQEQAERAEQEEDPALQEALEQMQQMMEQMQEMMEQLSPEQQQMAAQMQQQMMQQMQQQMQQSQQSQSSQQSSQNMMEQLQQQMQQMQQQMQQMQEMQELQEDLQQVIDDQQGLMEDTIADTETHAEELPDLEAVLWETLEYLEERSATLKENDDDYTQQQTELVDQQVADCIADLREAGIGLSENDIQNMAEERRQELLTSIRAHVRSYTNPLNKLMDDIDRHRNLLEQYEEISNGNMTHTQISSIQRMLSGLLARLRVLESEEPQLPSDEQTAPQNGVQPNITEEIRQEIQAVGQRLEEMAQETDGLETRQQSLQDELTRITREIERMGMDPGALSDAIRAMDEAESHLSMNDPVQAVPDQVRAMQELREGQEEMQQQMQQMMQQQQSQQAGGGQASPNGSDGQGMVPFASGIVDGESEATPNISNPNIELGIEPGGELNLSREIRDQIRQRLQGEDLTPLERNYLEGLLDQRLNPSAQPAIRLPRP